MTRAAELRGKILAYLLTALAILFFVFGIWAVSSLSDIKNSLHNRPLPTPIAPESGR
jgi:hypothetical protein